MSRRARIEQTDGLLSYLRPPELHVLRLDPTLRTAREITDPNTSDADPKLSSEVTDLPARDRTTSAVSNGAFR
jgi:hypothetical protein